MHTVSPRFRQKMTQPFRFAAQKAPPFLTRLGGLGAAKKGGRAATRVCTDRPPPSRLKFGQGRTRRDHKDRGADDGSGAYALKVLGQASVCRKFPNLSAKALIISGSATCSSKERYGPSRLIRMLGAADGRALWKTLP